MRTKRSDGTYTVTIPLPASARSELDSITGPGKTMKRGAYIAEAILEKLARGPARKAIPPRGAK